MESQREPNALRGERERERGWMADSNGVENQNQRPFYVGPSDAARARELTV